MPTDPQDVHRRFATLLAGAMREPAAAGTDAPQRVLIVTTSRDATLQLYFLKPLAALVERGEMSIDVLTELQIEQQFGKDARAPIAHAWLDKLFALAKPTVLVFCRYSGPHADFLAERARRDGIPVVYHIDDDLLNVPLSVGARKHRRHSNPQRLATVRYLLDNADLVYCSTPRLRERFEDAGAKAPLVAGAISCAGEVLVPAVDRPVRRVGYMGIDKSSDLELVLPALVSFLRRHPEVEFHLFGSFTRLTALEEFAERVVLFPSIRDYEEFLGRLAQLKWDIGICPLAPTPFNLCKANNKWIEYTSVGAAVIASGGAVYDQSCADGCGIVATSTDEWLAALEKLTRDPAERFAQVKRAQARLASKYTFDRLREQTLGVLAAAAKVTTAAPISQ
jgi:glycosyltransferase involved in cell wall biosynthesis